MYKVLSRRKTTLFSVAYSLLVAYRWRHAGSDDLSSLTATQTILLALEQVSLTISPRKLSCSENTTTNFHLNPAVNFHRKKVRKSDG